MVELKATVAELLLDQMIPGPCFDTAMLGEQERSSGGFSMSHR